MIRSEADELIFRHAAKSGAKTFDGVKINSIEFAHTNGMTNGIEDVTTNGSTNGTESSSHNSKTSNPGRPVSAFYTRKDDGSTGEIRFDYIVDASGRAGILNTKYLKNRHYNTALKNIANWAYYKETGHYSNDATRLNTPFFEALTGMSAQSRASSLFTDTESVTTRRERMGLVHPLA